MNCVESRLERRNGGAWDIREQAEKLHIAAGLVTNASTGIGTLLAGQVMPRAIHAAEMRSESLNSS